MGTLVESVSEIAVGTIGPQAAAVDRQNRFPSESFAALRHAGLLRYGLPSKRSPFAFSYPEFCRAAAVIGDQCLSTAIVWTMHAQQVLALSGASFPDREQVLDDLSESQKLVASITTEFGKGGDFLRAQAPLQEGIQGGVVVKRSAPIVSYGKEAGYFLITMRAEGGAQNATRLVLVGRDNGTIEPAGTWNALGMRGTQSIPMTIDVEIQKDRVIDEFQRVAVRYMIPSAHLGWGAAWFGAARGLYNRLVRFLRKGSAAGRRRLDSELLRGRLAEMRCRFDMLEALIDVAARRYQELEAAGAPFAAFQDGSLNILVNNVKVAVSRASFRIVDDIMEICGLFDGYLEQSELSVERVFRDLRSASMMFNNDRLLDANGRLALLEEPKLFRAPSLQ